MSTAIDELNEIIKIGFWRLDASSLPRLVALAGATFGDPPTSSALRRRLMRAMAELAPAYEDASRTLFGVSEASAGLTVGQRQRDAGQTPGLPREQSYNTVRGPGGLQELLVRRLTAYFEDGPTPQEIAVARGRGYHNVAYVVRLVERDSEPVWDITTRFTVEAYRSDVDLVTMGLHGRLAEVTSVEVSSPGHRKVGVRPATSAEDGPLQLVIGIDNPLPLGMPIEISVEERITFDAGDPDCSLGINAARFPTSISLEAVVPRAIAPRYTRLHEIRQVNNRAQLDSELIERGDDTPMTYAVASAEPHTRYALRWTTDVTGRSY